jgi:hypothetical protein
MEVEEKESSDTKESTVIKKNALSMNEKSSIALMVQEAQEKAFKAMLNATTSKVVLNASYAFFAMY